METDTVHIHPIHRTKRSKSLDFIRAILLALILIVIFASLISWVTLPLEIVFLISAIFLVTYGISLVVLLKPVWVRDIDHTKTVVKTVEKPIIQEKIIEKPVYHDVVKKVYVKPVPLNIPRFKYHGSTETRTYHLRTCRFGKLIKRKYNLPSNSRAFFIKKRFKACKLCKPNKK